ncbi:MAG: FlgO family outer membrane protein [Elusimicrobiota bacterium]|jgi:TolB-like protein
MHIPIGAFMLLLAGGFLAASPLHAGPYDDLASELSRSAQKSGYKRIAVLPFQLAGGGSAGGGMALSERLLSRLVRSKGIEVVERTLLPDVVKELELNAQGSIDPSQVKQVGRILGVEALVVGTYLRLDRRDVEVHTRLIDAQTARILGTASAKVEEDWESGGFWSASASVLDVSPPELSGFPKMESDPVFLRDAVSEPVECSGWERRVEQLQESNLEVKARYWAAQLRDPAFSPKGLTRNPGSDIRSLSMRRDFYARMDELFKAVPVAEPTVKEREHMEALDRQVDLLVQNCY